MTQTFTFGNTLSVTGGAQPANYLNGIHTYFESNIGYIQSVEYNQSWRAMQIKAQNLDLYTAAGLLHTSFNSDYSTTHQGHLYVGSGSHVVSVNGYFNSNMSTAEGGSLSLENTSKTGAACRRWTLYNMTGAYGNSCQLWRYPQSGGSLQHMIFNDSGSSQHVGHFGIGVNPSYPLHVLGGVYTLFNSGYHYNTGGSVPITTYGPHVSIYTDGVIWAPSFVASSDQRIKTEITVVDDDTALQQVKALETKSYHYRDPLRKRDQKTIGFIAQEVQAVIPNAVSLQKEFIPDELRTLTDLIWEDKTLIISDLDLTVTGWTGKVKFYTCDDVKTYVDEKEQFISCDVDVDGNKTNRFTFDRVYASVYLYGREVNDFHVIDKNQIFALHHSAIQELDRKRVAQDTLIEQQAATIATLTQMITDLTARVQALESS